MDNKSYDAENAVLSIIIENPEIALEATSLKTDMFSSIAHRQMFDHIQRLVSNGSIPDRLVIEAQIKENPEQSSLADFNFLQYILGQHYPKENFIEYLKIVESAYKIRELTKLASSLKERVKKQPVADEILESLRHDIDIISDVNGGDNTSHISNLVPDAIRELEGRKSNPNAVTWSSGFENFDMLTGGYKPGNVLIIAARPSVGKTAWMANSILHSAFRGVRSLTFEHEMNKQDLVDRLLSIHCKIPLISVRNGNLTDSNWGAIQEALDIFKPLPIYLDTNFGSGIDYLKSTTRKYVKLYGINVVFIDYIQLMVQRTDSMTMELGNVSRELKVLATKLGIQVVILSQLNRSVESRDEKRPTLSDLRQSGNLEEDADSVSILFREDMYVEKRTAREVVPLEFLIRKNRNGPIGMLPMSMNLETNEISGAF